MSPSIFSLQDSMNTAKPSQRESEGMADNKGTKPKHNRNNTYELTEPETALRACIRMYKMEY